MGFRFNKLWDVLEQRGITREQLRVAVKASQTTFTKLADNENVSLDVIDRICSNLGCSADDIMEFVPMEETKVKERGQIMRGDIYMCSLPMSESNTEARKKRPALVIQETSLCKNAPFVYVAALSQRQVVTQNPFTVAVLGSESNGLPHNQSFIMLSQIRQLRTVLLYSKLGVLEAEYMAQVDKALNLIFGL